MCRLSFVPAAVILSFVVLSGVSAFGATATGIKRPNTGETAEVLVQYASQPTEAQHRRVTDGNGRIRATFHNVPVAHYDVTPEALADLEADWIAELTGIIQTSISGIPRLHASFLARISSETPTAWTNTGTERTWPASPWGQTM